MKKQKPILANLVPEVKKVLEIDFAADSVDTLAIKYSISRNALQDAFKRECGIGILEFKFKQRMEAARKMLESGNCIKEVAFTLKYGTISNFSRAFKKYYTVSPTEWLSEVQNAY